MGMTSVSVFNKLAHLSLYYEQYENNSKVMNNC